MRPGAASMKLTLQQLEAHLCDAANILDRRAGQLDNALNTTKDEESNRRTTRE
jgi:hypothetical protein